MISAQSFSPRCGEKVAEGRLRGGPQNRNVVDSAAFLPSRDCGTGCDDRRNRDLVDCVETQNHRLERRQPAVVERDLPALFKFS